METRDVTPVQDQATARHLAVEQHVVELAHFLNDAGVSVGSFARAFGLSKLQAYRKVQHLLHLGLLIVAAERPRRGKPVKLYRCPHRSFFVPNRVVGLVELLEDPRFEARIKAALKSALRELRIAGLLVVPEVDGRVQMLFVDEALRRVDPYEPHEAAVILNAGELTLDFEDAKALQRELRAVIERYVERTGSGRYHYQIILTPDLGHP